MIAQLNSAGWWWLGTAVGGSFVLLLAAWAMRGSAPAATRQRLGELGVIAAILLAALRLGPTWLPITLPSELVSADTADVTPPDYVWVMVPPTNTASVPDVSLPSLTNTSASVLPTSTWSFPLGWFDCVVLGYLALCAYFLVRWFLGQWGLHRLLRTSYAAPPDVQFHFDSLVPPGRNFRLVVSDRVRVPMCCGLWRPTVLIPTLLVQTAGATTLRWVFAHELKHLERRDPWSCCLLGLAQSIYFFVPWFWWLRRQVRLCQEFVADAAAVAQGSWADDYAQFLVSLARSPAAPRGATGVLGNRSDLYRRVNMVLNPTESRRRDWSRGHALTVALLLATVAAIGSGVGLRTARADEKPTPVEMPVTEDMVVVIAVGDEQAAVIKDLKVKREQLIAKFGADHPDVKAIEMKIEAVQKTLKAVDEGKAKAESIEASVVWVAEDDGHDVVKPLNQEELEKKVRAALEKAKLSEEQVKQVLEELKKVHKEQLKVFLKGTPTAVAGGLGGGMGISQGGPFAVQLARVGGGGRLGVDVDPVGQVLADQLGLSQGQGLVIKRVRAGSTAEKAGFKANDILLVLAGQNVSNDVRELVKMLEGMSADKELDALVLRKGKKETVSGIKLAKQDEDHVMAIAEHKRAVELSSKELHEQLHNEHNRLAAASGANFIGRVAPPTGKMLSVTINNGELKASEQDGGVSVTVIGKVDGKKVNVSSVTISEPGVKLSYDNIDNVPEKYRERVNRLISNAGDSSGRGQSETR